MKREIDPAEQRLLDAALGQLFAQRSSGASPVASRSTHVAARRPLAAAALVLLGVGVVAVSWWASRSAQDQRVTSPQPQEPAPPPQSPEQPERFVVTEVAKLAELPDDVEDLVVHLPAPVDLGRVLRWKKLRRLVVLADGDPERSEWGAAASDEAVLLPLVNLPALESLRLPAELPVKAGHLAWLRALPKLSELSLANAELASAECGKALAGLSLRELELSLCLVGAPMLQELANARFDRLALNSCPGLDDDAFAAIAKLHGVRTLTIAGQDDEGGCSVRGERYRFRALGEAAFAAFEALPKLSQLDLDESRFDDRFLARLPNGLKVLNLGDRVMQPESIAALARLDALVDLTFHQGPNDEAAAELVAALRLERLRLRGFPSSAVVRAIAAHPTLESVTVRMADGTDLRPLVTAPRLKRVRLDVEPGVQWKHLSVTLKVLFDAGIHASQVNGPVAR